MHFAIWTLLLVTAFGWAQYTRWSRSVLLDQEFRLRVGERVVVKGEGLSVGFSSVLEDSRCPEDADCIWTGNGRVLVTLYKPGRERGTIVLNTHIEPRQSTYFEYRVRLVDLIPRPRQNARPITMGYWATLVVTKE